MAPVDKRVPDQSCLYANGMQKSRHFGALTWVRSCQYQPRALFVSLRRLGTFQALQLTTSLSRHKTSCDDSALRILSDGLQASFCRASSKKQGICVAMGTVQWKIPRRGGSCHSESLGKLSGAAIFLFFFGGILEGCRSLSNILEVEIVTRM